MFRETKGVQNPSLFLFTTYLYPSISLYLIIRLTLITKEHQYYIMIKHIRLCKRMELRVYFHVA